MANKYFRKYSIPSATTETTLYTVPDANTAVVSSLRITNGNASNATVTVSVYALGEATEYFVLKGYSLPTNATMDVFSGVPLVLEATDVLKIESSVATVHFYLSYLEMDRN
jgi:hypothetical protein